METTNVFEISTILSCIKNSWIHLASFSNSDYSKRLEYNDFEESYRVFYNDKLFHITREIESASFVYNQTGVNKI